MATLSSIITPTNITTASNTQTLTNKTLTGAVINGTVGGTTPSTVAATTLAVSSTSTFTTSAPSVPGAFGFRNRITNGAMRVDQRNVGASQSGSTFSGLYICDKIKLFLVTSCAGSAIQRVTDAPTGFNYSSKITIGTGASPAAGDNNIVYQIVEAPESADFNQGTANAVSTTVSFWVKSSVTGTYTISFTNSAQDRSYLAQYTVISASTWEYKTVSFTVDTSGTWLTAAGTIGAIVKFDIGAGTNFEGTASAWQAGNKERVSTNVKLCANTGATFQFTGLQWEIGTAATTYEQMPYQVELARCQRYFEKSESQGTAINTANRDTGGCVATSTIVNTVTYCVIKYKVEKASIVTPTVYPYTTPANTNRVSSSATGSDLAAGSGTPSQTGTQGFCLVNSSGTDIDVSANCRALFNWYCDTGF